MKLYFTKSCFLIFIVISIQHQLPAQANYQGKYKSQMEPGSKLLEETYTTTLEQIDTNNFIRKYFYPETKQITHFISYNNKDQTVKHGTYREWLDDGSIYVNGKYENDLRTGLWLLDGSTGYFINDQKDGVWERYDENNVLKSTETYLLGKLDGWYFQYDSSGIKKDSSLYRNGKKEALNSTEKRDSIKIIEVQPKYKNGESSMMEYVRSKLKYPEDAKQHDVQGKAIIEFTIERDGKVNNIKVLRGLCASIKEHCYQILEKMPDWQPGTQNGIPVRVKYTQKITFRLE